MSQVLQGHFLFPPTLLRRLRLSQILQAVQGRRELFLSILLHRHLCSVYKEGSAAQRYLLWLHRQALELCKLCRRQSQSCHGIEQPESVRYQQSILNLSKLSSGLPCWFQLPAQVYQCSVCNSLAASVQPLVQQWICGRGREKTGQGRSRVQIWKMVVDPSYKIKWIIDEE